jgi:hypothetical protein
MSASPFMHRARSLSNAGCRKRKLHACLIAASLHSLNANTMAESPPDFSKMVPTEEMKQEAKRNPNGWVYAIHGTYGPRDRVPPEAIAGAWRVDATGQIVEGSFVPNPRFKGQQQ